MEKSWAFELEFHKVGWALVDRAPAIESFSEASVERILRETMPPNIVQDFVERPFVDGMKHYAFQRLVISQTVSNPPMIGHPLPDPTFRRTKAIYQDHVF
jgi:hypothetical protein